MCERPPCADAADADELVHDYEHIRALVSEAEVCLRSREMPYAALGGALQRPDGPLETIVRVRVSLCISENANGWFRRVTSWFLYSWSRRENTACHYP